MRHTDPTPEQVEGFRAWMASRPETIQRDCGHLDPWTIYEHRKTGQRVTLLSMSEPTEGKEHCTVRIAVPRELNTALGHIVLDGIEVFGVDPSDLAPTGDQLSSRPTPPIVPREQPDGMTTEDYLALFPKSIVAELLRETINRQPLSSTRWKHPLAIADSDFDELEEFMQVRPHLDRERGQWIALHSLMCKAEEPRTHLLFKGIVILRGLDS